MLQVQKYKTVLDKLSKEDKNTISLAIKFPQKFRNNKKQN